MTLDQERAEQIRNQVYLALQRVIDPEVGINIVDLGLIYEVTVLDGRVDIAMTMTTPACPMSSHLVGEAYEIVGAVLDAGIALEINLVWEPLWSPEMMSDKAKELLGWK